MKKTLNTRITTFALGASLCAALAACGGGGASTTTNPQSTQNAATSIGGTVAVGTALPNATVTVIDANGKTATATTGTDGSYSASIQGMTAPFVLEAQDPSSASNPMYSVVASAGATGGAPIIANVTPLTTAVSALMTASGNPGDLVGNASSVTSSAITTAKTTLDATIAPILSANSIATNVDPIAATFTPNQTGLDAVLDSISVTPSTTGTGLQITSLADPSTAIQLNSSTSVTTALQNPSQPVNYLAALQAQLTQCLSDTKSANTGDVTNISTLASTSACSSAVDANYENDSYGGFEWVRQDIVFGTPIGNKTLRFIPAGTLNNNANPEALVEFMFVNIYGQLTFVDDIVQQLPSGNWDIIGDQNPAIFNVMSFVGKMQYTDAADANNGHYESGIDILAQAGSYLGTNPSLNASSVVVTGPGLPSGGVTLYSPGSGTGSYMTFLNNASTTTNANGGPNNGMSTQYKLAWNGGSFVPGTSDPSYASAQTDVSTVQQYGVYTATFYDSTGKALGNYQTINTTPNASAASGSSITWPQLTTGTIANLLTPGGSGATTASSGCGASCSTTVSWTDPANVMNEQLYNWATISSLGNIGTVSGVNTVQPYAAIWNEFMPTASGSTDSQVISGYVDQLTTAGSASAEAAAQVQLGWQSANGFYTNTWQYNAQ